MKLIENVSRQRNVSPQFAKSFLQGALASGVFVLSARFIPVPLGRGGRGGRDGIRAHPLDVDCARTALSPSLRIGRRWDVAAAPPCR